MKSALSLTASVLGLCLACNGAGSPSQTGAPGSSGTVSAPEVTAGSAGSSGAPLAAPPAGGSMQASASAGVAGQPPASSGGNAGTTAAPSGSAAGAYDYAGEQIMLQADLVVASGATVRVGPGTTFSAGPDVKVLVQGTLLVQGEAGAKVRFLGAGVPRSWQGIVVASGGYAELRHVEIGGATYGIHAQPGSDFEVDYAEIGTSFKAALVQANGSFDHTRFRASGDPTFSAVNEVSADDVNGTLTILDASPTITNSTFDGSAALVDMIRVGGNSSPVFDHVYVKEAHCGIHAFGGVNTTPVITNSVFERLAFGLMAYATKPSIRDSVFLMNANDVGFCFGATADNAPILANNYYSSGQAIVDPSCFQTGARDESPAASRNPGAGPSGL
jgi:hypothetical protein